VRGLRIWCLLLHPRRKRFTSTPRSTLWSRRRPVPPLPLVSSLGQSPLSLSSSSHVCCCDGGRHGDGLARVGREQASQRLHHEDLLSSGYAQGLLSVPLSGCAVVVSTSDLRLLAAHACRGRSWSSERAAA
jgi:hypothetical protein